MGLLHNVPSWNSAQGTGHASINCLKSVTHHRHEEGGWINGCGGDKPGLPAGDDFRNWRNFLVLWFCGILKCLLYLLLSRTVTDRKPTRHRPTRASFQRRKNKHFGKNWNLKNLKFWTFRKIGNFKFWKILFFHSALIFRILSSKKFENIESGRVSKIIFKSLPKKTPSKFDGT